MPGRRRQGDGRPQGCSLLVVEWIRRIDGLSVLYRKHMHPFNLLAGRRSCDTRDEFCASVSFISAGVLLPRPAHFAGPTSLSRAGPVGPGRVGKRLRLSPRLTRPGKPAGRLRGAEAELCSGGDLDWRRRDSFLTLPGTYCGCAGDAISNGDTCEE